MKKRVLSMLLTAVMILSLFAVPAFAEEVPLYAQFGYASEEEFMEHQFAYPYSLGYTYEEACVSFKENYARILENPQIAYDYYGITPEELEKQIAQGYVGFTPSVDAFYFEVALNIAREGAWNFVSPVLVQLDGERVMFPDAVPEITNDRTMVPFRAITEAMGFTVSYEEGAVAGVSAEKSVAFKIGETTCLVTDLATGETKTVSMDTAPYIKNDRTYVPVRFFAEAFGLTVCWDEWAKTAVLFDEKAWVEKIDKEFEIINEWLAVNREKESTRVMESVQITYDEFSSEEDIYPITFEVEFIEEEQCAQGTIVVDLYALMKLYSYEEEVDAAELDDFLRLAEPYLENTKAEMIVNRDTGKTYICCPTMNYLWAMTGVIPASEAENTWIQTDEVVDITNAFNFTGEELGEAKTVGEWIVMNYGPSEWIYDQAGAVERIMDAQEEAELFFGDSQFKKNGNKYTASWDYQAEDMEAGEALVAGNIEYLKGSLALSIKDQTSSMELSYYIQNSWEENGILFTFKSKSDKTSKKETIRIEDKDNFSLEYEIETTESSRLKAPLTEPPAGATIIDGNNLQ